MSLFTPLFPSHVFSSFYLIIKLIWATSFHYFSLFPQSVRVTSYKSKASKPKRYSFLFLILSLLPLSSLTAWHVERLLTPKARILFGSNPKAPSFHIPIQLDNGSLDLCSVHNLLLWQMVRKRCCPEIKLKPGRVHQAAEAWSPIKASGRQASAAPPRLRCPSTVGFSSPCLGNQLDPSSWVSFLFAFRQPAGCYLPPPDSLIYAKEQLPPPPPVWDKPLCNNTVFCKLPGGSQKLSKTIETWKGRSEAGAGPTVKWFTALRLLPTQSRAGCISLSKGQKFVDSKVTWMSSQNSGHFILFTLYYLSVSISMFLLLPGRIKSHDSRGQSYCHLQVSLLYIFYQSDV